MNCKVQTGRTGHLSEKDSGNRKHRPQAWERQAKAHAYWRESNHCGWTGRPTKPGKPKTNTSFNTPDIQREWVRHSVASYRSFTAILVWSAIRLLTRMLPIIVSFPYIYISQGSVATTLRRHWIFTNHFIANFPDSVLLKKLKKNGCPKRGRKCRAVVRHFLPFCGNVPKSASGYTTFALKMIKSCSPVAFFSCSSATIVQLRLVNSQ